MTPEPELSPLHVFEIEDGEVHWVAAAHPGEVSQIMADSHEISREEYVREFEPTTRRMEPHETIEIQLDVKTDSITIDGPLPENAVLRVTASTTARDWIAMRYRGIISTTDL